MIPGAVVTGWLAAGKTSQTPPWQIVHYALAAVAGGLVLVYAIGIPWLMFVTKMDFTKACWAMVVFVPGDVLKALVAGVVSQRIRRLKLV